MKVEERDRGCGRGGHLRHFREKRTGARVGPAALLERRQEQGCNSQVPLSYFQQLARDTSSSSYGKEGERAEVE